jgi:hypothetical protein
MYSRKPILVIYNFAYANLSMDYLRYGYLQMFVVNIFIVYLSKLRGIPA